MRYLGDVRGESGDYTGPDWSMSLIWYWRSEFTPLSRVGATQPKFHFSNLSSLMRRQVLVGSHLGEGVDGAID